jgi:2,6-dihydroxypseudooxynicotine hydrolase
MDWIEARADLDGGRIGLSGASMGGYYVPRVAAFDKRVKAAIANGGAFNVLNNFDQRPQTLKEAYRLRTHSESVAEAREKTAAFDLEGVAQHVTCPIMIIGAMADRITSYHDAERLAREVSGPVELLLLEGANHVAHNRGHMFKTQAADWMAGYLGVGAG